MATSRGERMQERMRGAGRHEVADDSFGFILPVEEASEAPSPSPSPAPESTPVPSPIIGSIPAEERRSSNAGASTEPQQTSKRRSEAQQQPPLTLDRADPYDLGQDEPRETAAKVFSSARRDSVRALSEILGDDGVENEENSLQSLPERVARPTSRGSISSRLSIGPHITEEVTESPAGAPGSGHRRRVRVSEVTTQSAELQRMVMDQEAGTTEELGASSPLARKTRMSGVTPGTLSTRSARTIGRSALAQSAMEIDELSPLPRGPRRSNSTIVSGSARSSLSATRRSTLSSLNEEPDELSSPAIGTQPRRKSPISLVESRRKAQAKFKARKPKAAPPAAPSREETQAEVGGKKGRTQAVERQEESEEEEEEAAEEVEDDAAARIIGKRQRRPSPSREESPELDALSEDATHPTKKRRRKAAQASPAIQSQPRPPPKKTTKQSQPRQMASKKGEERQRRKRHSGEDELVPISVQRYTQPQDYNEGDMDADILSTEIPFANRGGVNVVDVLAQMCDEVIESNLVILHEAATNADDSTAKKEYRTKLRALEAFQAELRTRLLEHAIALDTLHALKKRVRSIQKEKLALRDEIIRIRAEREQVALKMDAIRIQHEKESKRSNTQLRFSSTMHDIDLAVENGRRAAELDPGEQRTAELANLELVISRVADQVGTGGGHGNLKQIQEFNAILERAAAALEAR